MKIKTKQEFVQLYLAGVIGNRFDIYLDYKSAIAAKAQEVGFREMAVGAGSFEMCSFDKIEEVALRWLALNRRFYLNTSDKDHLSSLLIQGEICHTFNGYQGFIGDSHGLRMRDMFKAEYARHFTSAATRHLMYKYMDENTISDIDEILELYPDATIEFACYSKFLGCLPNRNTIIWEVRDY